MAYYPAIYKHVTTPAPSSDISDNNDGIVYRLGQIAQTVYNAFYDTNKNFISSFGGVGYNGGNTIPNNAAYVRFSGGNAGMVGEVLRKG